MKRNLLSVAYGLGLDSTAVLVGYWKLGIRPDLIIFSDVGAEREATYAYLPVINEWLRKVGFPEVTIVKYAPKNFKHWPEYQTIEENVLTNTSLPAIAYGGHSCSAKWKIDPQDKFMEKWQPALDAWARGDKVLRAVGFEDSPHELKRTQRCKTFAVQDIDESRYQAVFPLQEWGWNRERCAQEVAAVGLAVPSKSSCYFCTAMKPWEVDELTPDKHMRIVILEARAHPRHLAYTENHRKELREGIAKLEAVLGDTSVPMEDRATAAGQQAELRKKLKVMPPVGQAMTAGLWRKAVKGMRGATAKPGSMTEYIRQKNLLPGPLIDTLIRLTPPDPLTKENFAEHGIANWQDWLSRITKQAQEESGCLVNQ